jgi:hypothetical protein
MNPTKVSMCPIRTIDMCIIGVGSER